MKYYLSLFFILLLTMTTSANAYNNRYTPAYQQTENPIQTIQIALDKLQKFSTNKDNTNPQLLRSFIEAEIIPHFAFDQMTHWIAGPYARYMNAANMQELEDKVKKSFLNSLDKHLSTYNASALKMNFRRAQYRGPNEAIVSTMLVNPNQRPDRLDFRMMADGNGWKIVDVSANGISATLYYRQHFLSTLRQYR